MTKILIQFRYFAIVFVIVSLLYSCGKNKFDVNIDNIKVDLTINRLDLDLMAKYPDTPDVQALKKKYDNFLELYSNRIIGIGETSNPKFKNHLMDFNKYCKDIPSKVESEFGDFSNMKANLNTAFKYYKYYFPDKKIPTIYTFLSGFNQSVVIDEGVLGIGLDKYLGADCNLYPALGIDKYKSRRMEPSMLPVDCMRAMATSEFPFSDSASSMLNQIVYEGKLQYFLDAMLPFDSDTLKFGYTADQMSWAKHNESKIWAYLVENQLLFSTDEIIIRKMIGDGPFTTLFANNSAPRAGAFLGWKIIQKYMELNPKISLKELMLNNDFQGILNSAEYKP